MRKRLTRYGEPPLTNENQTPNSHARAENHLNSFDSSERAGLCLLAQEAEPSQVGSPAAFPVVNLHYHTFFSYNALGWSPSRIAWEAYKHGLLVAGIVDFDVLDGMEEFLAAGEILGLRTTAAMETRSVCG